MEESYFSFITKLPCKEFTTSRAKQELFLVLLLSNVELDCFITYMQNKNTKHLDEAMIVYWVRPALQQQ
jgi:hypothetical protein